jgi:Ni/Co efflux regulator RcnB
MKRLPTLAAGSLILGAVLAASPLAAAPAPAAKVVQVKEKRVVVKPAPAHRGAARRVTPRKVIVRHPHPRRPGHFWHRGTWRARIHAPAYRWPRGRHYRVWAIGAILPPIFFAPDYYYGDYARLGLQAPPPGYRWVRYGDDLLLVNLRTGEVEDVVYDVFD